MFPQQHKMYVLSLERSPDWKWRLSLEMSYEKGKLNLIRPVGIKGGKNGHRSGH